MFEPDDWLVGQSARLSIELQDSDGVAVDAAAVRFKAINPDGAALPAVTLGAHGISKTATGAYHYDLLLTQPGTWYWRWETDTPATAAEGHLNVNASRFSP